MSNERQADVAGNGTAQEQRAITFAEFLEDVPPNQILLISDVVTVTGSRTGDSGFLLNFPEVRLHCGSDRCNGIRFFRLRRERNLYLNPANLTFHFISYECSNCQAQTKIFSIAAQATGGSETSGRGFKFGEYPTYGPPTPSRLIGLIGPDREMFLQGRRCENQGLGIGAFSYYRRVVENQKSRILDNIIRAAETLSSSADMVAALREAQKETQFKKAVESIASAIPHGLLIKGQNPMTLLHSALSEGLHEEDDQTCLSLAHDIRVVLAELSDRLGQVLKDDRELNEAVTRLMQRKAKSGS